MTFKLKTEPKQYWDKIVVEQIFQFNSCNTYTERYYISKDNPFLKERLSTNELDILTFSREEYYDSEEDLEDISLKKFGKLNDYLAELIFISEDKDCHLVNTNVFYINELGHKIEIEIETF